MARPKCARLVDNHPHTTYFKPRGIPLVELEEVVMTLDECEAMRLADLEGLYQEEAATRMQVSRATFGRIVESAHRKVAEALIRGKAISIQGGVVMLTQKRTFQCADCEHTWQIPYGTPRPAQCPQCGAANLHRADAGHGFGGSGGGGRGRGCRRRRGVAEAVNKENT